MKIGQISARTFFQIHSDIYNNKILKLGQNVVIVELLIKKNALSSIRFFFWANGDDHDDDDDDDDVLRPFASSFKRHWPKRNRSKINEKIHSSN